MGRNKQIRKLIEKLGKATEEVGMPKAKVQSVPDTETLKCLLEEYQEMLRDAERGVKKTLTLNPRREQFWDELTTLSPLLTMVGARANSIQEEIDELIGQLPED